MGNLGAFELFSLALIGAPLLIALDNIAPLARMKPELPLQEVDMVRAWASVHEAWRDGDLLVVRSGASLPDRCISTNQPAAARMRLGLIWHPPALYLALFGSLWLYVLLALLIRKRVDVEVSISQKVVERRQKLTHAAIASAVIAVLILAMMPRSESYVAPLIAVAAMLPALFLWWLSRRLVRAVRIDGGYAWIKGVSPAFLMLLPSLQEVQQPSSFA